ncbi:hypothetical protein [Sandaracinobacter neustonicus]|nr:hypothetical protein [Sandaracinobacter neustonicus]
MSWTPQEEQEFLARRRRRNIMIGLVLGAFALLFYGITVSRMVQ